MGLRTRSLYPCEYGRFVSRDTLRDLDGLRRYRHAPNGLSLRRSRGVWNVGHQPRILSGMTPKTPHFQPEKTKDGRWFVAVKTGNGPDSHIGDFDTEADAERWIATKAKYWPGREN